MRSKTAPKETIGKDELQGSNLDDTFYGGNGKDTLFGLDGNDSLFGGNGQDTIDGGDGDDLIYGGHGDDWLAGGTGADIFVIQRASGRDVITDFFVGEQDSGVINFDDIEITGAHGIQVMEPEYSGLTWSNFYLADSETIEIRGTFLGDWQNYYHIDCGYTFGVTSGTNVAFGWPAATLSGEDFRLESVNLTAAWNNNMSVYIFAYNDGALTGMKQVVVNSDAPTYVEFTESYFESVDEVRFSGVGGENAGYGGWGSHLVFDDLQVSGVDLGQDTDVTGSDLIDLSAAGIVDLNEDGVISFEDLQISQVDEDSLIQLADDNSILLSGVDSSQLSADHFIF